MIKSRIFPVALMSDVSGAGGFCPGLGIPGVSSPPRFPDAADQLTVMDGYSLPSGSGGC